MTFDQIHKAVVRDYCVANSLPVPNAAQGAPTDEIRQLCRKAVESQNKDPGDIETWARSLANDVKDDIDDVAAAQHAQNRAYDALVSIMLEFIETHGYEDCLSALNDADVREQEMQAARDDETVRGR